MESELPRTSPNGPTGSHGVPRGVLVLGMHRSGTSAVAGLSSLLGLSTCRQDDLITGRAWNPRGHWESRSLTRFNDQLLTQMGRSWWYPPPAGAGYAKAVARIAITPDVARRRFDDVHPSEPWVWKDPQTCLTLPFWRQALGPVGGIAVYRNPLDVATSLAYRNGLPTSFGVALWARYGRLLLEHAGGMPLLVSSYDDVVQNPVRWSEMAREFLAGLGVAVHAPSESQVRQFIDPQLRHFRHTRAELLDLSPGATTVFEAFEDVRGAQLSFQSPPLADEDPAVEMELQGVGPDWTMEWHQPPWSVRGDEGNP